MEGGEFYYSVGTLPMNWGCIIQSSELKSMPKAE